MYEEDQLIDQELINRKQGQDRLNKMNCELMLTYDTPTLRQTGSRNLTGQKTLPTIWGTYMKLVTKYQISAIIVAEKNVTKNVNIQMYVQCV